MDRFSGNLACPLMPQHALFTCRAVIHGGSVPFMLAAVQRRAAVDHVPQGYPPGWPYPALDP